MELRGKRVVVTGADGFIGSHLVEQLLEENCEVRAFVYYNSSNSWGWLDTLPRNKLKAVEIFAGDIRDAQRVEAALRGRDVVFHLAALVAVPFSYHSPDSYLETNVSGTLSVLQGARKLDVEKLLVTSSSEVYGTALYVPIDEKHPLQAQSPYSATKIGADKLAESFYRVFNLPVVTVRPFNTFGPRQSARAVVPTIISQLTSGANVIRLGSLEPTRDFNYVKDTVSAFVEIAKSPNTIGEEINVATGIEISIGQLATELISQINPQARIAREEIRVRPGTSEVERLVGCNKKIVSLTKWKPQYTLAQGLAETITWFGRPENMGRYKEDIFNL